MIGALIGLGFGWLWLIVGATATPSPLGPALGIAGTLAFAVAIIRIVRRPQRRGGVFHRGYYVVAVAAEIAAIMAAQSWLLAHGRPDLLLPVVGIIVGLHFIGLWPAMERRAFLALAGTMVAINLAALLLPLSTPGRARLSGFGSAVALLVWASA